MRTETRGNQLWLAALLTITTAVACFCLGVCLFTFMVAEQSQRNLAELVDVEGK